MPGDQHIGTAFALSSRLAGDSLELVLAGDLDMVATFRFEPAVEDLLRRHPEVRRLVVDLADVEFIDSSGLGALLAIRQKTRDLGVDMTLAGVSDQVGRVLDLSGTRALLMD